MASYAEQIAAFEAKRAVLVAANLDIMAKAAADGSTLDAEQTEQFDGNQADIEAIDAHIKRLRVAQETEKAVAAPVAGSTAEQGAAARTGAQIKVKQVLAPGIGFARIARVKALAKLDGESVREKARELYGEESETYGHFVKAAVAPATTTGATWASPLIGNESIAAFLEFLRPKTILGKFGQNGIPALTSLPFRIPIITQTSGGAGYWVGEGKGKPLTKFDFSRTEMTPLKVANIAVATEETLRDSSPAAEALIRDQLAAALAARLDTDFIDPTKAAVAGVSPASITNGLVVGTSMFYSSGNTADNIRTDVKAATNAFIAANNAPTDGVWIMPSTTALALSMINNPLGQPEFPGITMNGGMFFGLPVITSQYAPTAYDPDAAGPENAGAIVALVKAGDIGVADEGGVAVDMSREASLEMADNPAQDATTSTGAQMVSMFQTNSVAFRAERTINWTKLRSSAVAMISSVNWS